MCVCVCVCACVYSLLNSNLNEFTYLEHYLQRAWHNT